jgi:hypothetical protein
MIVGVGWFIPVGVDLCALSVGGVIVLLAVQLIYFLCLFLPVSLVLFWHILLMSGYCVGLQELHGWPSAVVYVLLRLCSSRLTDSLVGLLMLLSSQGCYFWLGTHESMVSRALGFLDEGAD